VSQLIENISLELCLCCVVSCQILH